jgi:hypothetical protein
MSAALFGHTPISGLRLLSGVKRKLDFELRRAASGAKLPFTGMSAPGDGTEVGFRDLQVRWDPKRTWPLDLPVVVARYFAQRVTVRFP